MCSVFWVVGGIVLTDYIPHKVNYMGSATLTCFAMCGDKFKADHGILTVYATMRLLAGHNVG